jgi:retinol dehydrogenase 12
MTVVITGCTSGIGLSLAIKIASEGVFVIGVGRDEAKCANVETLLKNLHPEGLGQVITADLSTLKEAHKAANEIFLALNETSLDALINNAGVFSSWYITTAEGFELQFAVNQLIPFALTHLLMPALQKNPSAKVITVGSDSHQGFKLNWDDLQLSRRYNGLSAYRSTKLMNLLFTLELARRLESTPTIKAYAVDPGLVATDMGFKGTNWLAKTVWAYRKRKGRKPEESAQGLAALAYANPSPWSLYWLDGKPKQPSPNALDKEAASRLWAELERMSGLNSSYYGLAG